MSLAAGLLNVKDSPLLLLGETMIQEDLLRSCNIDDQSRNAALRSIDNLSRCLVGNMEGQNRIKSVLPISLSESRDNSTENHNTSRDSHIDDQNQSITSHNIGTSLKSQSMLILISEESHMLKKSPKLWLKSKRKLLLKHLKLKLKRKSLKNKQKMKTWKKS